VDDRNHHADRLKMWTDFNHAWLGILQRQKDMLESGQQPQRSQSLVTKDGLEKMGRELVRLCDGVERFGLVDYEYGVWEERIVAGETGRRLDVAILAKIGSKLTANSGPALTDCLDLYESGDEAGPGGASKD
jgi:hypothetical protein